MNFDEADFCHFYFINSGNSQFYENLLCFSLIPKISITLQVIKGLYTGVTTQELDTLAAETAATMTTDHADYAVLAARISISNLHKETKKSFSGKILTFLLKIFIKDNLKIV